jgi:hypothetical protein
LKQPRQRVAASRHGGTRRRQRAGKRLIQRHHRPFPRDDQPALGGVSTMRKRPSKRARRRSSLPKKEGVIQRTKQILDKTLVGSRGVSLLSVRGPAGASAYGRIDRPARCSPTLAEDTQPVARKSPSRPPPPPATPPHNQAPPDVESRPSSRPVGEPPARLGAQPRDVACLCDRGGLVALELASPGRAHRRRGENGAGVSPLAGAQASAPRGLPERRLEARPRGAKYRTGIGHAAQEPASPGRTGLGAPLGPRQERGAGWSRATEHHE